MRLRLGAAFASAVTISIGVLTVIGLLITDEWGRSAETVSRFQNFSAIMLQIVTVTIAMTVLVGILNLIYVHLRRVFVVRDRNALYSIVVLVSFVAVLVTYVNDRETNRVLLETVLISVESAIAGLVLFALVFGAYRMMHKRVTWARMLFVTTLLIVLVGTVPLSTVGFVREFRDWLFEIPVSAGARGILLGIALATLVTGVRVLVGVDRSYRE